MADFALLGGVIMLLLAVASSISAFSGDRGMRPAVTLAVVGIAMIGYASYASPIKYRAQDIPTVLMRILRDVTR